MKTPYRAFLTCTVPPEIPSENDRSVEVYDQRGRKIGEGLASARMIRTVGNRNLLEVIVFRESGAMCEVGIRPQLGSKYKYEFYSKTKKLNVPKEMITR